MGKVTPVGFRMHKMVYTKFKRGAGIDIGALSNVHLDVTHKTYMSIRRGIRPVLERF